MKEKAIAFLSENYILSEWTDAKVADFALKVARDERERAARVCSAICEDCAAAIRSLEDV